MFVNILVGLFPFVDSDLTAIENHDLIPQFVIDDKTETSTRTVSALNPKGPHPGLNATPVSC